MRPKSGRRKKKTAEALKESIVNLLINNLANMVLKYYKLSAILIFISSWSLLNDLDLYQIRRWWYHGADCWLLQRLASERVPVNKSFVRKSFLNGWVWTINPSLSKFLLNVSIEESFDKEKVEIGLVSKCKPQTTYHWKELWIQENFCQQFENTFIPAVKIELLPLIYSNTNYSNSRVVVDFCKDSKGGGSKSTDQPKAEDYPSKKYD